MLDAETLKAHIHYEPETGVFTWLRKTGKRAAGSVAGYPRSNGGYVILGFRGDGYLAHRLAFFYMTGNWPEQDLDHKNGNRQDNRWVNLRACSRAENMQNLAKKQRNTGQWLAHNGKYRARISCGNKRHNLGYFDTAEEASDAYMKAKAKIHAFNPEIRELGG